MVSERTFLMKLFLAKNLDEMREMCVKRSEELDEMPMQQIATRVPVYAPQMSVPTTDTNNSMAQQSPSMQRIMAQNPDLIPAPKAVIPATPAAAQALADRQRVINERINPKEEKRTSPRKF